MLILFPLIFAALHNSSTFSSLQFISKLGITLTQVDCETLARAVIKSFRPSVDFHIIFQNRNATLGLCSSRSSSLLAFIATTLFHSLSAFLDISRAEDLENSLEVTNTKFVSAFTIHLESNALLL